MAQWSREMIPVLGEGGHGCDYLFFFLLLIAKNEDLFKENHSEKTVK